MKSLHETILFINNNYPQDVIVMNDFDLSSLTNLRRKQPKYLFRGERTNWKETKSTSSRKNLLADPKFDEINYWVSGMHKASGQTLNIYSLYFFLRQTLWSISSVDEHNNAEVEKSIAGLLQHYEFDTSFIDLTSDINVAAFFASFQGQVDDIGQILIIPTTNIENRFFDLTGELGDRPKNQKAYVILAPQELDLKSQHFKTLTHSTWIEFKLTAADKEKYCYPNLLSTSNDKIVNDIFDWFESHIQDKESITYDVRKYFSDKIDNLKKYCG